MSVLKYCEECGSPLMKVDAVGFSPVTGNRNTRLVCSKSPCEHSGHEWVTIDVNNRFFRLWDEKRKCTVCGIVCKFSYTGY